jgi:putative phosphoesterase
MDRMAISIDPPRRLRVALLSDTHGFLDPRVGRIVAQCDLAVHAGDIGGLAVLQRIRPRSGRVIAVRGNNDNRKEWPHGDVHGLLALDRVARLALPGGELAVIHGHRSGPLYERHRKLREHFPEVRAVVVGHSHRPACDCAEQPWILNPGAAGRFRTFGKPGCLVLEIVDGDWSVEQHCLSPLPRRKPRPPPPEQQPYPAESRQ